MISSAWKTITQRFGEVFTIVKPVLLLTLLNLVINFAFGYLIGSGFVTEETTVLIAEIVVFVVSLIINLIIGLIYVPAAFRTFQKRESDEVTTVAENVAFAKTHKMEYFKVVFWNGIMSLIYMLLSVLPAIVGIGLAYIVSERSIVAAIIIGLVGGAFTVYLLLKNLTKFIFSLNVYFATGKSARESVKESMRIGTEFRSDSWAAIGRLIVVGILTGLAGLLLTAIFLFPEYKEIFANDLSNIVSPITQIKIFIVNILATFIDIVIALPMTAMLLSKSYLAIKAKGVSATPVVEATPVSEVGAM